MRIANLPKYVRLVMHVIIVKIVDVTMAFSAETGLVTL